MNYEAFLAAKALVVPRTGLGDLPEMPTSLAAFQADVVRWALRRGRAALFEDTGLGKTRQQLVWGDVIANHTGGMVLILAPLAVSHQTIREGQSIGIDVQLCASQEGAVKGINITNYEKLDRFDLSKFTGIILDESSILKSFDSKIRSRIIEASRAVPYRLACTATPAPNDHVELGNHAEFLGVMSRTEMLAEFFVHDGGDTSSWRLKGHAVCAFWAWVASWAAVVQSPADLGYEANGYNLPPLKTIEHVLDSEFVPEGALFALEALTLADQRKARRNSLEARVRHVAALVEAEPLEPWVIWCDLNDESEALTKLIPGAVEVTGSDSPERKEATLRAFSEGRFKVLVSKASICGFGMNWQHCARTAFVGIGHSFEMYYQAVRRFYRFGQSREVSVHLVYSDAETAIARNLWRKQADALEMAQAMRGHTANLTAKNIHAAHRETNTYAPHLEMQIPSWLESAV